MSSRAKSRDLEAPGGLRFLHSGRDGREELDAEGYLDSLELHGWRFGLDRMRKLVTAMGLPQHRYASIHVVGTNGKSSTARMIAAILEAHGLATGAYLSPHISSWTERIEIRGRPIDPSAFADAVERTASATTSVERSLDPGDAVTQFEALTAAAFQAFAAARVDVAVVEAGLGGRLDATNVIPSKLTVLTSIGLEHTDLLGTTEAEIAAEKLAVLRDRTTLVHGPLSDPAAGVARKAAAQRHAKLVDPSIPPGSYRRRNLALAAAAAETFLGRLDQAAVEPAGRIHIPGRLELVDGDPPILLDVAHNPDGMRALVESLPGVVGGKPVVACVAVLADKDAEAMLAILAPGCAHIVCTETGTDRSRPAADLAVLCEGAEAIPDPAEAIERARALARELGGVALVTGSHYLLGQVWTARPAPSWPRSSA